MQGTTTVYHAKKGQPEEQLCPLFQREVHFAARCVSDSKDGQFLWSLQNGPFVCGGSVSSVVSNSLSAALRCSAFVVCYMRTNEFLEAGELKTEQ